MSGKVSRAFTEASRWSCGECGCDWTLQELIDDGDYDVANMPCPHCVERLKPWPTWQGSPGLERIAAERRRQVEIKGWSEEHDDDHASCEMAMAAACYAASEQIYVQRFSLQGIAFVDPWPWDQRWDARPLKGNVSATLDQRIRMAEKAGALIAAELDRLLRAKERGDADA